MRLRIAPEIIAQFPSYRLLIVTGGGVQVQAHDQDVESLLGQQEAQICRTVDPATLSAHPHIASWRRTYASFGARPGKYRCAVETLMRAILKRGSLPRINSVVDICNYVSVKYVLPIDVMDLDNIEGDISVRLAAGGERFLPLGAAELEPPNPGEVIYSDAVEVLGRRWNWRKSEKSKVTLQTKTILITIEGIEDIALETLQAAEAELRRLLSGLGDGGLSTYLLGPQTLQVNIPL